MKVSVVIPCYYSEATISKVVRLTRDELRKAEYDYEFILVNDGSIDKTFSEIESLCNDDSNIVGVDCAKNLGQHSAIMAGLHRTTGELIMLMDDDMQTHPSQCLKLLEKMNEGWDVVFAKWPKHKESWWRSSGSRFNRWTARVLANFPKDVYLSNYFVMRDYIRDEIIRYQGPYVSVQGLIARSTDSLTNAEVKHFAREQGQSGYTMSALIRLWSIMLNFSMKPIRFATFSGFILGSIGVIAAIVVVINRILDPSLSIGWPSLMAVMLACSGLIILFLGILGEYIGRLFMSMSASPQFVIKRVIDRRSSDSNNEHHQ